MANESVRYHWFIHRSGLALCTWLCFNLLNRRNHMHAAIQSWFPHTSVPAARTALLVVRFRLGAGRTSQMNH